MTIRDQINQELDRLPESLLPVMLRMIRRLSATRSEFEIESDTESDFVWSHELRDDSDFLEDPEDDDDYLGYN